jgi:3-phosphoshikimate 1-carboxyvinyltransferase
VALTISLLDRFGIAIEADPGFKRFRIKGGQSYRSVEYRVEGDWSGAAFILVAAAVGGEATDESLSPSSLQADRRVHEALRSAGAELILAEDAVTVRRGDLRAFEFDASDCPDLFPPLAALGLHCAGTSRIFGAGRLKHKESDRPPCWSRSVRLGAPSVRATSSRSPVRVRGDPERATTTGSPWPGRWPAGLPTPVSASRGGMRGQVLSAVL